MLGRRVPQAGNGLMVIGQHSNCEWRYTREKLIIPPETRSSIMVP